MVSRFAEHFKSEENIVDFTQTDDWLTKFGKSFGTALGRGVGEVLGGNFSLN